jgi:hypothetical protein
MIDFDIFVQWEKKEKKVFVSTLILLFHERARVLNELGSWITNNSYNPITNTAWVCTRLSQLQKEFYYYIYITPVNNLPLGARKPQRFTNIYNEQYN